jgi:serine O-acetyltransferase
LNTKPPLKLFLYLLFSPIIFYYRHLKITTGIQLPVGTQIGPGLVFEHYGSIILSPCIVAGRNLTVAQNVTIGLQKRGAKRGAPSIGDNVFIGPGAVILGNIRIGSNVAIGGNSVVLDDIPDNAVAAGAPAKVVSYKGSAGYIFNHDYDI